MVPHGDDSLNTDNSQQESVPWEGDDLEENLGSDEDDRAGVIDECPGLAHSDVKLPRRAGECCTVCCYKMC